VSWGIVQHEFAHEVDYFLFDDATREQLLETLGGREWWAGDGRFRHDQYGAERFASTLAWAYWPSRDNVMRFAGSESRALPPAQFRLLVSVLEARLGVVDTITLER
jgi:hypothetical protein